VAGAAGSRRARAGRRRTPRAGGGTPLLIPLPPIEGLMPGGGPSPAETTLPLALKWPAPPTRPQRPPPPGQPGAPHGWRRVPRTGGYAPPNPAGPGPAAPAQPPRPQPTFTPTPARPPGTPGPPAPPGGPGGPGGGGPRGPAGQRRRAAGMPGPRSGRDQRSSLVRSGAGMAVGTPGLAGHRLPAHARPGVHGRHRRARQRLQQRQHAAEHGLLPDARRHLHQRGGTAAGLARPARPGPGRVLRAADLHPGCAGPAGGHRCWPRCWPVRWCTCTRPASTARTRT